MGTAMLCLMSKVSEKTNKELSIHLLSYFFAGWLLIAGLLRFINDMDWSLAFIGGFVFSAALILFSLISILHERK